VKLASIKNNTPDGQLVVVSRDLVNAVAVSSIPTMQYAMDNWETSEPELIKIYDELNSGVRKDAFAFNQKDALAPLPRAYQWIDTSSYLCHGRLLDRAFGIDPIVDAATNPIMYQGASDAFVAGHDDAGFVDDTHGIDFEGELGMIIGAAPAGIKPEDAVSKLRLIVLLNDWSCRALQPYEMKRGFGLIHSKAITGFAPVAITPDELGDKWQDGKINLRVHVWRNEEKFGSPIASAMDFHYSQLIASAARTRPLGNGTVMGFGTVSEGNPYVAGSCCITEKRGQEIIDDGKPSLPFMSFGEKVKIEVYDDDGKSIFGSIEQKVVKV
jgi:fumarylacetoacetate (FAA) hydrolase